MRKSAFRGRRAVRLAALLVLAGGTLTGCGVRETAVIEAGRPAVADLLPPREGRVLLFFFSPDNELLPVPRTVETPWRNGNAGSSGPDDSSTGPDESHGQDGLGGSLPAGEETSESLSPRAAVTALLAGPDKAERRAGLRNAPSLPRTASAAERIVTGGPTVEVKLRLRVTRLTAPARDQIVCTAAYAAHAQGAVSVSLVGQDGRLAPADCPVRPVKVPAR
ncbi:hypothetical protein OG413_30990 [Streptomyces sp. NBC_01433]|uniref:hypothetical protein n=1 Tax=Streptomyces sp. NBC_01433 TaxID=2903864 RepID=UPI00224D9917|nr:hypothetical protein [Streptomyces sp. NBC_01433]MCX4679659.1 hypothetical protein [Streptomyces sp. NBC_01433]